MNSILAALMALAFSVLPSSFSGPATAAACVDDGSGVFNSCAVLDTTQAVIAPHGGAYAVMQAEEMAALD